MALDPLQVAIWRFEIIAPLLDPCLSRAQRSELIDQIASQSLIWPSGRDSPIDRSTLYLWLKAYRAKPCIEALQPCVNKKERIGERIIKPEWITYALALVEENPQRSLFILGARIASEFKIPEPPSRSSLHRALRGELRYVAARATTKKGKRRTRFVATQIHQIWHADAKADFKITCIDGTSHRVRILSILDDCSRYILAALVVKSESLVATVKTFTSAALRFGLPLCFYADRGSPYDSNLFRQALAILGIQRINTKPRNPSAHGKIEAYHRSLHRWFITELPHQPLRDLEHLQLLLDAMIDTLYHGHIHRELKQSPADAFNDTISQRSVSVQRLHEAFLLRYRLTPERKTGNVKLGDTLFLVPAEYLVPRRKLRFAYDLTDPAIAYLIDGSDKLVKLETALRIVKHARTIPDTELPPGSLSPLLEIYRGRTLPRPVSGFGLPEIYKIFSESLHRDVPATEAEGSFIISWLREYGPFEPTHFTSALAIVQKRIGHGRPLVHILKELSVIIKTKGNRP